MKTMHITRTIQSALERHLFAGKIIVIFGARQVGKTTLIRTIAEAHPERKTLFLNCDEPDTRSQLFNVTSTALSRLFGSAEMICIDEAQRVKNIGLTLKLAVDTFPEKQFIVTGSSSFDLANSINEPLTGRKYEFHLYPFSLQELSSHWNEQEQNRLLFDRIIFGLYPDVVARAGEAQFTVENLVRGTLYKDALEHQTMKHAELLEKLLRALAFQIGKEVSYQELANTLQTTKTTIERYVRLLEQSFIVYRLTPFSRNIRSELRKLRKIYFFDTGVRNALIGAFGPTDLRDDIGALWENFLLNERMKHMDNAGISTNRYFWRTHQQQEIDLIEERDLTLSAFEFKWNPKKSARVPKPFRDAYPGTPFSTITQDTYREFVGLS